MANVKTLVVERDGAELFTPEEISQTSDLLSALGVAFKGSSSYTIEQIGGIIKQTIPDYSQKPTYTGDDLTALEVFNGVSQITANRLMRGDFTYTSDNITSESWKIYDTADGTTVLKTITLTHTYTGDDLTNTTVSEA